VMSHLVGVPVYQEYMWDSDGEHHLAIHGHQFDNFIIKNHLLINGFFSSVYLFIQKISSKGKIVARMLDKLNTRWQRLTPKVAQGAIAYARSRGATRVFCGHTHDAIQIINKDVTYYNSGSWTNHRSAYITVLGQEVTIHEHFERINNHYTGEERRKIIAAATRVTGEPGLPLDVEYEGVPG